MALSEHEQRLLDQLERQLHEEDPRFASSMEHGPGPGVSARRVVLGILGVVLGLVVVVTGVGLQNIFIGVAGFLIAAAGGVYAATRSQKSGSSRNAGPSSGRANKSSFMEDLEQKWDERRRHDS